MTRLTDEVRETVSPHKFGGSRKAAAAWIISGEGSADDESGDVDAGGYFARIGRHVLVCDSAGFVGVTRYADETEAAEAFEEASSPDVWQLLEDPPEHADRVADLYHWSTNYDPGRGPMTLFLDLIGWTDEQGFGEPLYDLSTASLGYVELSKLAAALTQYAQRPHEVRAYVDALMEAESRS
jgi:hypothetical protein